MYIYSIITYIYTFISSFICDSLITVIWQFSFAILHLNVIAQVLNVVMLFYSMF